MGRVVPLLGRLVTGDPSAYAYLPASVAAFPRADELAAIMAAAGLTNVRYRRLGFGAVALHVGEVPGLRAGPERRRTARLARRRPAQKRRYAAAMELVEERLDGGGDRVPRRARRGLPGHAGRRRQARAAAAHAALRPRGRRAGEPVLRAAAAVELLHMATLVHDDVLDRAELRRGRPTVAHEYGVDVAVSAGNYLLARAFSELVGAGDPAAVDLLSATAVGLREGEVLQRAEAHDVTVAVAAYERRCERKTADLFAAACRLGALLSGAGDQAAAPLGEYGRLIGLAFQVFDDILDCSGDEASTGKRPGTDVRDGTITLPMIYALEARPELGPLLARRTPTMAPSRP